MSRNNLVKSRGLQLGALVTAGCLVLAACSSDTGSGSASSSAASGSGSSSSGAGGEPIVIGYAASQSGPQAQNGLLGVGVAHAWQESINAAGGINGRNVDIQVVDTKNTAPGAISAFQGFEADPTVDAIMMTDLVAENTIGDTFKSADLAVLSGGASADQFWYTIPNLFQPVSGRVLLNYFYSYGAKAAGKTTLGFAACQEVAVCADAAGAVSDQAAKEGLTFSGMQLFSASASDYTAQCLGFKDNGTDAIAMNIGVDTGIRVMADCLQQGYEGVFLMPNSGFDQAKVTPIAGAQTVDTTQGFPWWADDPAVKAYRDAMTQYSPDTSYASGTSTSVWSMLELVKKGLENTKPADISRASVLDAMYSIKDETLGGLLPQPTTFTKGQPSPEVKCSWLFKFAGGDENPTTLPPEGTAGNGGTGDLASSCLY